jgi:multiple sugar transport system permease protein
MTSPASLPRSQARPDSAEAQRERGQPRGRARRRRRQPFRVVALLPLVAFLLAFTAYPLVQLARMSFSNVQIVGGNFVSSYAGAENYRAFGADDIAHYSFFITGLFILVTVPATVILGTLLALLVHRSTLLAGVARNVLLWPALIAPVVVSVIWWLILTPNFGSLNKVFASLGMGEQGWLGSAVGAVASIIVVDTWHWTPLVFILIFTAVQGVDPDLFEAARVDGASDWQVYRHVVLPLLIPAILAASLIRLTMGAKAFDEMYVLTQGGPDNATNLVSLYIRSVFFDQLELGYGAAISILVIVAVAVALGLVALGRALRPGTREAADA